MGYGVLVKDLSGAIMYRPDVSEPSDDELLRRAYNKFKESGDPKHRREYMELKDHIKQRRGVTEEHDFYTAHLNRLSDTAHLRADTHTNEANDKVCVNGVCIPRNAPDNYVQPEHLKPQKKYFPYEDTREPPRMYKESDIKELMMEYVKTGNRAVLHKIWTTPEGRVLIANSGHSGIIEDQIKIDSSSKEEEISYTLDFVEPIVGAPHIKQNLFLKILAYVKRIYLSLTYSRPRNVEALDIYEHPEDEYARKGNAYYSGYTGAK